MPVLDPQALIDNRVQAIRAYHESIHVPKAQIDVSGGLDSAVIVGLLAKALGPENVTAVHSGIHSNPDHLKRAREVCDVFGVKLAYIDLTDIYEDLVAAMQQSLLKTGMSEVALVATLEEDPTILGSIRSTLRAPVGRGFNRIAGGGIRHGTGNECEDRWARFYQKGGDGEVDTNPIAMLAKGEVFQLALALGVPKSIITAMPSPDLWGNGDLHNDEDEFAAYFRFNASDHGHTFYSYIDVETGQYRSVGLIERVSRFLDLNDRSLGSPSFERALFSDNEDDADHLIRRATIEPVEDRERDPGQPSYAAEMRDHAHTIQHFDGLGTPLIDDLLRAARRIERATRHKYNPNCPTLGERDDLVDAGILTNELPEV